MSLRQRVTPAAMVGILIATLGAPAQAAPSVEPVNISAELASAPYAAKLGEQVTHRVAIRNDGPGTARNVRLDFASTADFTVLSSVTDRGGCAPAAALQLFCELGTVKAKETALVSITVVLTGRPPSGDLVRNVAAVSTSSADSSETDDLSVNSYVFALEPPVVAPATAAPDRPATLPGRVPLLAAGLVLCACWAVRIRLRYRPRHRRPFWSVPDWVPDLEHPAPRRELPTVVGTPSPTPAPRPRAEDPLDLTTLNQLLLSASRRLSAD